MPETTNHTYNVPAKTTRDWATLLNQNFEALEVDAPIVDGITTIEYDASDPDVPDEPEYTPHQDALFVASDTGDVYRGDGSNWVRLGGIPRQYKRTASGDGSTVQFTLSHSLYAVPIHVSVTPTSRDAMGERFVASRTNSSVTIEYASAPPSGTDNLTWDLAVGGYDRKTG